MAKASMVSIVIAKLILFPKQRNIIRDPSGKEYPLVVNNSMMLMVWKISGRSYLCQKFQNQLQNLSQGLDELHLRQIINRL